MTKRARERDYLKSNDPTFSLDLGRLVAEEDRNLSDYYVAPERYADKAIDPQDPAVFFVGPKGIGKSAILQMVRLSRASESPRIINISPDDLAFSALANIEAKTPLLTDKNKWLFKCLWDYVLSLEIVRREHKTTGAIRSYLLSVFRNQHEKEQLRLLKISLGDDGVAKSLSTRILQLVEEVELSAEADDIKVSGKAKLGDSGGDRGSQLHLLSLVSSVAKTVSEGLKHPYYILIDDLDTNWTDTPTQNAFIAALFQSLRNFSKPPNLKCVVAMRENIYKRLPLTDRDKIPDWVCQVEWDLPTVKEMIGARIHSKLGCPMKEVWGGMFPENGFEKMWKHTFGRPRELVRLATICLKQGKRNGHLRVEDSDISEGLASFSEDRLDDLTSEHSRHYPGLGLLLRKFHGWPKEFQYRTFVKDFVDLVALEVELREGHSERYQWFGGFREQSLKVVMILMEIGFLMTKSSRGSSPRPYDDRNPPEINNESWLAIHPTYWHVLALINS